MRGDVTGDESCRVGEKQRDGEVREFRYVESDWIAHRDDAGPQRDASRAAERERTVGYGDNGRAGVGAGDDVGRGLDVQATTAMAAAAK